MVTAKGNVKPDASTPGVCHGRSETRLDECHVAVSHWQQLLEAQWGRGLSRLSPQNDERRNHPRTFCFFDVRGVLRVLSFFWCFPSACHLRATLFSVAKSLLLSCARTTFIHTCAFVQQLSRASLTFYRGVLCVCEKHPSCCQNRVLDCVSRAIRWFLKGKNYGYMRVV